MNRVRRLVAALVALSLLCTLFPLTTGTAAGTNLTLSLNTSEAEVDDIITVTVSNRAMSVCTFTGGVAFDPDMVVCTGINPAEAVLTDTAGHTHTALRTSSLDTAEKYNAVGFAFVNTAEKSYRAGTLLTVTFRVIGKGNTGFTLYEDSDGSDAFSSPAAETVPLHVNGAFSEPVFTGDNIALDATATADSFVTGESGASVPENMNDGDRSTRWQSASEGTADEPAWAALAWKKEYKIGAAKIMWTSAYPAKEGFKFQISADGEKWTDTPISVSRETSNRRVTDTVTLTDQPKTKYLRVYCFDNGENKYTPTILEWEVYDMTDGKPVNVSLTPTVSYVDDSTVTLTTVAGYEYRMADKSWQKSPTFTGLSPETTYVFYQRAPGEGENAPEVSAPIAVTTSERKVLLGDVNLDGVVDAADLTALARHVGGIEKLTGSKALLNADTDGADGVGAPDLTLLARFVGGIISKL